MTHQEWPAPSQPVSARFSPRSSTATSPPANPSAPARSRRRPSPTPSVRPPSATRWPSSPTPVCWSSRTPRQAASLGRGLPPLRRSPHRPPDTGRTTHRAPVAYRHHLRRHRRRTRSPRAHLARPRRALQRRRPRHRRSRIQRSPGAHPLQPPRRTAYPRRGRNAQRHGARPRARARPRPSPSQLETAANFLNEHFRGWNIERVRAELARRIEQERSAYRQLSDAVELWSRAVPPTRPSTRPSTSTASPTLSRFRSRSSTATACARCSPRSKRSSARRAPQRLHRRPPGLSPCHLRSRAAGPRHGRPRAHRRSRTHRLGQPRSPSAPSASSAPHACTTRAPSTPSATSPAFCIELHRRLPTLSPLRPLPSRDRTRTLRAL